METKQPANRVQRAGALPLTGAALLVCVCMVWGGNMVTIKFSNMGVPPVAAAALRSLVASMIVLLIAMTRGEKVFFAKGNLLPAMILGTLFGLDFLFLYWGAAYTDASRAIIFLYTQPLWSALGAHFFLKGDRLTRGKVIGLFIAFAGMASVLMSRSTTGSQTHWIGDFMEIIAAMFWASTTIFVKRFSQLKSTTHYQSLFSQLFFSLPVLIAAAIIIDWGKPVQLTGPVLLALTYQCLIVASFSYLLWFWMIHRYPVSVLTSFTFLVPIFGVLLSGLILNELMTIRLIAGLAMVATGIYLVNRSAAKAEPVNEPIGRG
jgi:drug/metabolite transporter (DMT)-like permease